MNPDVYNPKSGIYVLEISVLDDNLSVTTFFDATTTDITLNDIYKKIYGDKFSFLQPTISDEPIIKNIRFIPYIWKNIF